MKCTGSKTWQGQSGKRAKNMGKTLPRSPSPGPPLMYPEKSINWTEWDGSHRRAMGDRCEGWGSSIYRQDMGLIRALRRDWPSMSLSSLWVTPRCQMLWSFLGSTQRIITLPPTLCRGSGAGNVTWFQCLTTLKNSESCRESTAILKSTNPSPALLLSSFHFPVLPCSS